MNGHKIREAVSTYCNGPWTAWPEAVNSPFVRLSADTCTSLVLLLLTEFSISCVTLTNEGFADLALAVDKPMASTSCVQGFLLFVPMHDPSSTRACVLALYQPYQGEPLHGLLAR